MTVGIKMQYHQQVLDLLTDRWPDTRRIFKVKDVQKLVGKVARLGEGARWIYKIMSHIYTSLAYALK
jgi:CTP-dependent riboflavin kinase